MIEAQSSTGVDRFPEPDANVRSLVSQLVAALTASSPAVGPASGDLTPLLDIEVDGVRCRCDRVVASVPGNIVPLSPREHEITRMVASGRTNQAIADVLGISVWTVSTHLRRIFAKLGVNSRAAMVACVLDTQRWLSTDALCQPSTIDPAGAARAAVTITGMVRSRSA